MASEIPLLGVYDIISSDASDEDVAFHHLLKRLVSERAREVGMSLNRDHQRAIGKSRLFTNLSEYFEHSAEISGRPYTLYEQLIKRFQILFARGLTEIAWDRQARFWVPLIFIKEHQLGGQLWFTQALLHELQHAAEGIISPESEAEIKKKRSLVNSIYLCALIAATSTMGEMGIILGKVQDSQAGLALVAAAIYGALAGMVQLGRYYFSGEERRARATSTRIRK